MEQSTIQQSGGDPDLLDTTGLCLLSLDGGGVRGLSTLYILKSLMDRLNHPRKETQLDPFRPCDVFDLIGGTSTGGLIAIMLGRLEMDVDECIKAYSELMANVFGMQLSKIPMNWKGKVKPRFDSKKLEEAIKQVIRQSEVPEDALLDDGVERGCRSFVCTIDCDTKTMVRLRSYSLPDEENVPASICQAALATSAATAFFPPVNIDGRSFADGGIGANNPVDEVEGEASSIWSPATRNLQSLVKCFVSIGTGNPGIHAFEDGIPGFLSSTVSQIATETEATDKKFIARWARHYDQKRYFRFNVEQGLQDVGLAEYQMEATIEAASDAYLDHTSQEYGVRDCIRNLSKKQNRTGVRFNNTLKRHDDLVARQQLQEKAARRKFYDVPHVAVSSFSGRKEILEQIDNAFPRIADLATTRKPPVFVLQGMGGQGKSQIALEYCRLSRSRFQAIFWIDATSEASVQGGFERIVKKFDALAAAGPHDTDEKIDLVQKNLASLEEEWLLVFDNYDDPSSYKLRPYLLANGRGFIILTSRHEASDGYARPGKENFLAVPSMEHDGGHVLLQNKLSGTTEQERSELLQRLGGLALAIDQAAAYISFHRLSIPDFMAKYETHKAQILKHHEEDTWEYNTHLNNSEKQTALTAYTTWEMILPQIEPDNQDRRECITRFLSISAFLGQQRIGEHIFREFHTNHSRSPTWLSIFTNSAIIDSTSDARNTRPEWDGFRFQKVIRNLEQLSLVSDTGKYSQDTGAWFSIQPVVRDWLQIRMESNVRQETLEESIYLVKTVTALEVTKVAGADVNQELLNHVDILVDPLKALCKCGFLDDVLVGDSAIKFGHFYLDNGHYKKAIELLEYGLDVVRASSASDKLALRLEYTLAVVYNRDRQSSKAIELLEHVVRVQNLEETHPDRLASQHALALAYRGNGQVEDAIKLLEHVVTIRETSLTDNHPDRLASQHVLAIAYRENGQVEDAIKLLEHVVNIQEVNLGEHHPDRLASQHALAMAYRENGQVEDAIKLLEHVVNIRETILPETHPDRLASQHVLAIAYRENGQVEDAIKLLEHVVNIQEVNLGEHHPDRLASQHELAVAYRENGQVGRAFELLEHVAQVWQRTDRSHPDYLAVYSDLAEAYRNTPLEARNHSLGDVEGSRKASVANLGLEKRNDQESVEAPANSEAMRSRSLYEATDASMTYSETVQSSLSSARHGQRPPSSTLPTEAESAMPDVIQSPYKQEAGVVFSGDVDRQSIASVDCDIQSLAESRTFSNVREVAAYEVAKAFTRVSTVSELYDRGLKAMEEVKFLRNHGRLLKYFYLGALTDADTVSEKLVVQFFRSRIARERISHWLLNKNDDSDETMDTSQLEPLLAGISISKWAEDVTSDAHDNGDDGNNDCEQLEKSDYEDSDSGIDEDDASELTQDAIPPLIAAAGFLTNGQAFQVYQNNLARFVHNKPWAPKSFGAALKARDEYEAIKLLGEEAFAVTQVGSEFEWIAEALEMGLSPSDIVHVILEQNTRAPWIFYDPPELETFPVNNTFHRTACAHDKSALIEGHGHDPLCQRNIQNDRPSSLSRNAVSQVVTEVCGLAGVVPYLTPGIPWAGNVSFHDTSAKVTYETLKTSRNVDDEAGIVRRILCTLDRVMTLIAWLQHHSFVCDHFVILRRTFDVVAVESIKISFGKISELQTKLGLLAISMNAIDPSTAQFIFDLLEVFCGKLDSTKMLGGADLSNVIVDASALVVQALCLGMLTFGHACTGELNPFFLDHSLSSVSLNGADGRLSRNLMLSLHAETLTCMGDMINDPVMVFCCGESIPGVKHHLQTSFENLFELWGPGHMIVDRSEPPGRNICGAELGGGIIYRSSEDFALFHWSREVLINPDTFAHGSRIASKEVITIGALYEINPICPFSGDLARKPVAEQALTRLNTMSRIHSLGTFGESWALRQVQAGLQTGQYVMLAVNATWVKSDSRTLKIEIMSAPLDLNDLEAPWGVLVSICTGVALRVPLREAVAEVMVPIVSSWAEKPDQWQSLLELGIVAELKKPSFRQWFDFLDTEKRRAVTGLVTHVLSKLCWTGINQTEEFVVASPTSQDNSGCVRIPCIKNQAWTKILKDSQACATFACLTTRCIQTGQERCKESIDPKWLNQTPHLATAVCQYQWQRTEEQKLKQQFEHDKLYYWTAYAGDEYKFIVRPSRSTPAVLSLSASKLPRNVRLGLERMARLKAPYIKLEEQRLMNESDAEDVLLRFRD